MPANSKSRGKLKKRLVAGGVIGALAAVIAWIASLMSGLGFGLGSGGDGIGPGSAKKSEEPPQKEKPERKRTIEKDRVVTVQIDGEGIRLQRQIDGGTEFEPITIPEVVKRAGEVEGTEHGAKVHINFRGTGLREDDRQLQEALRKASIKYERFTPDFR